MKSERPDTASFSVLTFPPRHAATRHQNRHTHNKTKKQRQCWQFYTWAKCQNRLWGGGAGRGREGRECPTLNPSQKQRLGLLATQSCWETLTWAFPPDPLEVGPSEEVNKGLLDSDMYMELSPQKWGGRTLTTSPTLADGNPMALLNVAELVI